MENCGHDLEHEAEFSASNAISLIKQIAANISKAETSIEFEHRDLHPGNILIKKLPDGSYQSKIIDFTLSRCKGNGVICFADLDYDPEIFDSQGMT